MPRWPRRAGTSRSSGGQTDSCTAPCGSGGTAGGISASRGSRGSCSSSVVRESGFAGAALMGRAVRRTSSGTVATSAFTGHAIRKTSPNRGQRVRIGTCGGPGSFAGDAGSGVGCVALCTRTWCAARFGVSRASFRRGNNRAYRSCSPRIGGRRCLVLTEQLSTPFDPDEADRFVRVRQTISEDSEPISDAIDAAETLDDPRVPPGNRLEKLRGDRVGQHSIRVNDQWRICFAWREGDAYEVSIVHYH